LRFFTNNITSGAWGAGNVSSDCSVSISPGALAWVVGRG